MSVWHARRRIRGDDVELAVAEAGDRARPTVLLIHGYPDTHAVWQGIAHELAGRFHVVAYDVRGAGGSTPSAAGAGYALACLGSDARAVLDACAPEGRVHLVGHDWGAIQGWEFATDPRIAERLASFTAIAGPCLDHVGSWLAGALAHPAAADWATLVEQAGRSWYVAALSVPGFAEWAWPCLLEPLWPGFLTGSEALALRPDDPAGRLARDGARGAWLYRENVARRLARPRANARARVPVQLIVPLRDRFLSPRLYDGLAPWMPGALRRDVDAGHWIVASHAGAIARWVGDFADAHGDGPRALDAS